jgi:hypothetical protein
MRLVRFAKRRTAWESTSADDVCAIEFRDPQGKFDLRPSVYKIAEEEITRCYAEHAAAIPIDPPRTALAVFSETCAGERVRDEPGADAFAFIRERHREVDVADETGLKAFVECLLRALPSAGSEVKQKDLIAYARARIAAADPEWLAITTGTAAKPWLRKLAM